MRAHWLLVPVLPLAAACGTSGGHPAALAPAANGGALASTPAGTTSPSACRTSDLSIRLGARGAAAGSAYAPLLFTDTGATSCTLLGYPGVSYVTAAGGNQVGTAAIRNPQHSATTVTLVPGAVASALVQMVDEANFPPSSCSAVAVGALRVYPPGSTTPAYVTLPPSSKACSGDVQQLTVTAVASS